MDAPQASDSFQSFRESFSYGERNNVNFKYFKSMSDVDVASFLEQLLDRLGDAYDTGDVMPLIHAAYEAQIEGYKPSLDAPPPKHAYDDGPFAPLKTPISEAKVGLLTTSGHFVTGDDPQPFGVEAMTQDEAMARIGEFLRDTPVLSTIPSDTATSNLEVRHGGYDIASAVRDPNVTFPIDRLRAARDSQAVGSLASTFFSFPGATSHGRLRQELPGWVERMHEEDVDVMLLVPV